jgi:hypothetical protein
MAFSPMPRQAQDDGCPVPEELIGRLYRANEGLDGLLAPLSKRQRGQLAFFCYARGHLRQIGFAVAATCDLPTLVDIAGHAGEVLHAQSRGSPAIEQRPVPVGKRKVSLANSVLSTLADEGERISQAAFA